MKSILLFVVFIGFFSCSTSSEETSISSEIIDEDIVKINDLV